MTELLHLPPSAFLFEDHPPYEDIDDTLALYDDLAFRGPVARIGPKGTSKSLSIRAWCVTRKHPLITMDCSEDLRRAQIVGTYSLRARNGLNETPFVLGPLTTAIKVANEYGTAVLNCEELNALTPQAQKILNGICDFRQSVDVTEAETVVRLVKGAKVWVYGSLNTVNYAGVYQLNEDLISRIRFIRTFYPEAEQEKRILRKAVSQEAFEKIGLDKVDAMLDHAITLAAETRGNVMEYALSPRDLVQLVEDFGWLGTERALKILLGKFEDKAQRTLAQRLESLFGVKVS